MLHEVTTNRSSAKICPKCEESEETVSTFKNHCLTARDIFNKHNLTIKGARRVQIWLIMEIDFTVFSERREWYLRAAFYLFTWKILILAKVIASWRSAPMCNSIVRAIFRRNFPQMTLFQTSKSIFSYNFWAIISKLSGYVLGM